MSMSLFLSLSTFIPCVAPQLKKKKINHFIPFSTSCPQCSLAMLLFGILLISPFIICFTLIFD